MNNDETSLYEKPTSASEAFTIFLKKVGGFGLWQWRLVLVTSFCGMFTGPHNFAAVFLAGTPYHHCDFSLMGGRAMYSSSLNNITWKEEPREVDIIYSKCQYMNLSNVDLQSGEPFKENCYKWHYNLTKEAEFQSTVVSDYDLVCGNRWLMSTIQASFMIGILAGAVIFSIFSDKYGRRKTSIVGGVVFFLSSVLASFSSSLLMFIILRFIVAASGQGMFLVNYVVLMECTGDKGRTVFGNLFHAGFAVGLSFLPLIAYFFREWRELQLAISIPTVAIILLQYWLLPESPRWYMINEKYDEGLKIYRDIAKCNGRNMPSEDETRDLISVIKKENMALEEEENQSFFERFQKMTKNIVSLVRTKNMRRRSLITFYAWFVISMMYYGLTFNGGNINASLYLNVFLSGLVEIPAIIFSIAALFRMGRRNLMFFCMILSGISCLSITFIPKENVWVNVSLSLFGKCLVTIGFYVAFMFSAELVPTHVRNVSLGMASMCGRIGSTLSPYIVDLLGDVYYAIPSTVFGVAAILCALLTILLPETRNKRLPESVEEIESLKR